MLGHATSATASGAVGNASAVPTPAAGEGGAANSTADGGGLGGQAQLQEGLPEEARQPQANYLMYTGPPASAPLPGVVGEVASAIAPGTGGNPGSAGGARWRPLSGALAAAAAVAVAAALTAVGHG